MRYSSFITDGPATWGVVTTDGTLVDARTIPGAPATLDSHIDAPDPAVVDRLRDATTTTGGIDTTTVTWLPPVRRPGKILGVAINNVIGQRIAHRPFANPAFFFKPPSSLVGHGQPVVVHESYGVTHPEPELAVVIGRGGRDIAESDALAHVFGYTIINDITSPGLKEEDSIEIVAPPGSGGGAYGKLLGWRHVPRRRPCPLELPHLPRPLEGHRHVRPDRPVDRHRRRDPRPEPAGGDLVRRRHPGVRRLDRQPRVLRFTGHRPRVGIHDAHAGRHHPLRHVDAAGRRRPVSRHHRLGHPPSRRTPHAHRHRRHRVALQPRPVGSRTDEHHPSGDARHRLALTDHRVPRASRPTPTTEWSPRSTRSGPR